MTLRGSPPCRSRKTSYVRSSNFMRRILSLRRLVSFGAAAFGFAFLAHGQGRILTFEGLVTRVPWDLSGLAYEANLYPGQAFSVSVLIDPSRPGLFGDTNR